MKVVCRHRVGTEKSGLMILVVKETSGERLTEVFASTSVLSIFAVFARPLMRCPCRCDFDVASLAFRERGSLDLRASSIYRAKVG